MVIEFDPDSNFVCPLPFLDLSMMRNVLCGHLRRKTQYHQATSIKGPSTILSFQEYKSVIITKSNLAFMHQITNHFIFHRLSFLSEEINKSITGTDLFLQFVTLQPISSVFFRQASLWIGHVRDN